MMYQLYGFPLSRTSRVLWTFAETGAKPGVDYEFINIYPHSDAAYKVNPTGKLPVLINAGQTLIDSTAICIYLADKHANDSLSYPAGSFERAQMDSWIQFAISDLEAPLWMISKHSFVLEENLRVPEIFDQCEREWQSALDAMATRLGNKQYVMGDQFTVADIILGQIGGRWAKRRNLTIADSALTAYFDRVCHRPAISQSLELEQQLSENR